MNKPIEVHNFENRLDVLFGKIGKLEDIELRAHWARYLCVMVSGYLETSIREILGTYAQNTAAPPVRNYVESELRWFQNPNTQKTFDLLRQFNPDWADQLKIASGGEVLAAVDSVNNNRNNIVHGRQVGISFAVIQRYYADIKTFVATILAIIP